MMKHFVRIGPDITLHKLSLPAARSLLQQVFYAVDLFRIFVSQTLLLFNKRILLSDHHPVKLFDAGHSV